jgi:hypothetical protein
LYAADLVAMSIPRQVGKTYLFAAVTFALCLLNPGLTVIWTAHRAKTAKETFSSMSGMAFQERVAPHIAQVVRSRGDEAVIFTNGSRILFGARESGFGRGFSNVGILVFDEAQILTESAMEDMVAAQNVAVNPLTILTGTPPRPRDPGEVFTMVRQESLSGHSEDSLYVELSADRDCDLLDRSQWRRANPSFPQRTSERAMLRMKKNLSDDSFRREALGVWDEISVYRPVVTESQWRALEDVGPGDDVKPNAFGVDMSHGRAISVGAAWQVGDAVHLEEVWAGTDEHAALAWLVQQGRRIPVVVDSASPAASLVPQLRSGGCKVRVTTAGDMARACLLFEGAVLFDGPVKRLSHGGQESLTRAVGNGRKRPIRDAGGWGWDRRDPNAPIHPIVAGTLAILGAAETKRARGGATFV